MAPSASGRPTPTPTRKPSPPSPVAIRAVPLAATGWTTVVASSYGIGDGFLGGHLACGGRLDTKTLVVAHKSLPCGTKVQLRFSRSGTYYGPGCTHSGGRTTCVVTATVRDRGPYVRGRTFDLGPAVSHALHFTGLGSIGWRRP